MKLAICTKERAEQALANITSGPRAHVGKE